MASSQATETGRFFLSRRDRERVLYVILHHDYSGAELMHLPLMDLDSDPLLACPPDSRTEEWAWRAGIPTVPLPFRSIRHSGTVAETLRSVFRGLAGARDLRRILRSHPNRRLIYCITLRPGMLAALAGIGLGRRVVWFLADFPPPAPILQLTRLLARIGCDHAVALSQAVRTRFTGRSRRLARRTSVIYPGTDLDRVDPERADPGAPRAAMVGQISPTKRTDLALEVARLVSQEFPDFCVEILGRAQYRDSDFAFERDLKRRVEEDPRLRAHVLFRGYVPDPARDLHRFGLLLHFRSDEPFGIVLIEAMAAGLPVVAPSSAGPTEILEHGVNGLLFTPDDAEDAARCVMRLLQDRDEARRMGAEARRSAKERFGSERQLEQMDGVLASLASSARP